MSVYLIRTREFINSNQPIYIIGKTKNFQRRFKQYPKKSEALIDIKCNNIVLCEREIRNSFNMQFENIREYGKEYYKGDPDMMIYLMKNITQKINRKHPQYIRNFTQKRRLKNNEIISRSNNNEKILILLILGISPLLILFLPIIIILLIPLIPCIIPIFISVIAWKKDKKIGCVSWILTILFIIFYIFVISGIIYFLVKYNI